jgi:hypothetical protein
MIGLVVFVIFLVVLAVAMEIKWQYEDAERLSKDRERNYIALNKVISACDDLVSTVERITHEPAQKEI